MSLKSSTMFSGEIMKRYVIEFFNSLFSLNLLYTIAKSNTSFAAECALSDDSAYSTFVTSLVCDTLIHYAIVFLII